MRTRTSVIVMCLVIAPFASAAPDRAVRSLIDGGHWKQARAILEPRLKANPNDAEAAALLSRVRHQYGDLEGALPLAETAVRLEPKVADYHWQLAEVVGEMAQRASVLKQFGLGRRFKREAEAAMALDVKHLDAREGMIDFYIQAPGIIGGDRKKADQTAISRASTSKRSAPRARRS